MSLTLNDIRSVLGRENDGNLVFSPDANGAEKLAKVNYGKVFKRVKTPDDVHMNARVHTAVLNALVNSVEARAIGFETLSGILARNGMPRNLDDMDKPLARRTIAAVISEIDENVKTGGNLIVGSAGDPRDAGSIVGQLKAKGVFNADRFAFAQGKLADRKIDSPAAMLKCIPAKTFGCTSAQLKRFVTDNFALLQAKVFDDLYFLPEADRPTVNLAERLTKAAVQIMSAYALGHEPTFHVNYLRDRQPSVALPEDVTAFRGAHLQGMTGALDRLFGASSPFGREHFGRIGGQVGNVLLSKLEGLFQENGQKTDGLEQRLKTDYGYPTFASLTTGDVRMMNDRFCETFRARLNAALYGEHAELTVETSPAQTSEQIAKIAEDILKEMLAKSSDRMTAALDGLIGAKSPNATDGEKAALRDAVRIRLANLRDDQSTVIDEMRAVWAMGKEDDETGRIAIANGMPRLSLIVDACLADAGKAVAGREESLNRIYAGMTDTEKTALDPGKDYPTTVPFDSAKTLAKLEAVFCAAYSQDGLAKAGILDGRGKLILSTEEKDRAANDEVLRKLDEMFDQIDDAYLADIALYVEKGLLEVEGTVSQGVVPGDSHPVLTAVRERQINPANFQKCKAPYLRRILEPPTEDSTDWLQLPDDWTREDLLPVAGFAKQLHEGLFPHGDHSAFDAAMGMEAGDLQTFLNDGSVTDANGNRSCLFHDGDRDVLYKPLMFRTQDVGTVAKLLKTFGLTLDDAETGEGYAKLLKVEFLALAADFKLEGLREWGERMTGKSFDEMTAKDLGNLLRTKTSRKDPLELLSKGAKKAAAFISGKMKASEMDFSKNAQGTGDLVGGLRKLTLGLNRTFTAPIAGKNVEFTLGEDGRFTATVDGLSVAPAKSPAELLAQIENDLAAHADRYDAAAVKAILPESVQNAPMTKARLRELCTKILAAKLGEKTVRFASMPLPELLANARLALDGRYTKADLADVLPTTYNSAEAIELHQQLIVALPEELEAIRMPPAADGRGAGPGEVFRNLIGDLVLNEATWSFDEASGGEDGTRVRNLLKGNVAKWREVTKDDGAIESAVAFLPEVARDAARNLLNLVKQLLATNANLDQIDGREFANLEKEIGEFVNTVCGNMQEVASRLFAAQPGDAEKKTWMKSFGEVNGTGGLDLSTAQGRFLKQVLDRYFSGSAAIEKRAMVSAFLRHADAGSSEGRLTAEMLKGAGPLLQKMLQGLPMEMFSPETQVALRDMKSRLAPIPDDVVKAQMLELVRSSGGKIRAIEVKRSLGAATVGQAFLCHIVTEDHPITGENVVIKLLRPNVSTAIQREYDLLSRIAAENGMGETFAKQYEGILRELDFTLEAENIELGASAYNQPKVDQTVLEDVRSMTLNPNVAPTSGALVLSKVEGTTYDSYIASAELETRKALEAREREGALEIGGEVKTAYFCEDAADLLLTRSEADQRRAELVTRYNHAINFVKAWTEQALFGDGFFHGDLHAGNLMTDGKVLSVIDYGNAMRLDKDQQNALKMLFASCMVSDGPTVLQKIKSMLPPGEAGGLDRLLKDPAFMADFQTVVSKGSGDDVALRLTSAIALLQQKGVVIPSAVNSFIQSLERLQGVITGLESAIRETESEMNALELEPGKRAELEGELPPLVREYFPQFEQIDKLLVGAGGTGTGPDLDGVRVANDAMTGLEKQYVGETNGKKLDFNAKEAAKKAAADVLIARLMGDPQQAKDLADAIVKRYGAKIKCVGSGGATTCELVNEYAYQSLVQAIESYGREQNEKNTAELQKQIGTFVAGVFGGLFSLPKAIREGVTCCEPLTLEADFGSAMTDVLCGHLLDLGGLALGTYGLFQVGSFKAGLGQADGFRAGFKAVLQQADARNGRQGPENRLDFRTRATIVAEAKCFRRPIENKVSVGDNDTKKGKKLPSNAAELAEVLKVNLDALKAALGRNQPGGRPLEALTGGMLSYWLDVADGALLGNLKDALKADGKMRPALETHLAQHPDADLQRLLEAFDAQNAK